MVGISLFLWTTEVLLYFDALPVSCPSDPLYVMFRWVYFPRLYLQENANRPSGTLRNTSPAPAMASISLPMMMISDPIV
jgi:hypothetical protein